ncbi:MAG: carbohydrate ABC transporter permease [Spirochaetota bacterium]
MLLSRRKQEYVKAALYIGPSIVVLLLIAFLPVAYAVRTSLWSWHLHRTAAREPVGLGNYLQLFGDLRFLHSLGLTFLFTLISVSGTMVLGFLLALLVQKPFRGKNLAMALLSLPMIMTPVVSALMWRFFFFEPSVGLVNWFLSLFKIRGPVWVASSPWAFVSVVIVTIWFMTPFVMLIMEAALVSVPKEPLEAAILDGAGYWQRIRYIVIPMIRGTIMFTLIFRITIDYRMFDIVYTMTRGGPAFDTELLSIWVYNVALRTFEVGYANAGATVMMLAIGVVCLVILLLTLRGSEGRRWS